MKTLLLGMGNPMLCDDAVGVRLTGDLACRLDDRSQVDVLEECCVGGLNLLDVVSGYDRLVVIDSIRTGQGSPGGWYRFTGRSLRETMNLNNVHDANFATALQLGRSLGVHVPSDDEIHILAVEVDDNLTFSETMTPVLEEAYPELLEEIGAELRTILATPGPA